MTYPSTGAIATAISFRSSTRPETPFSHKRRSRAEYTAFVSEVPRTREGRFPQTGAGELVAALDGEDPLPLSEPTLTDKLSEARDTRLALLARKFEGDASVEDKARIHLLTARLRRLDPRVTEEERHATEAIVQSLEGVAGRLEALKVQFGL